MLIYSHRFFVVFYIYRHLNYYVKIMSIFVNLYYLYYQFLYCYIGVFQKIQEKSVKQTGNIP